MRKKGSTFLIGFATAAVTFGILMASLGPQKFGKHCSGNFAHHHAYQHCSHACEN